MNKSSNRRKLVTFAHDRDLPRSFRSFGGKLIRPPLKKFSTTVQTFFFLLIFYSLNACLCCCFLLSFFFDRIDKLSTCKSEVDKSTRHVKRCMTFADCRLQTADCRLQTADCRLQTADQRLQTADCRPKTVNCKVIHIET